jgi:release factor glutamine methyltransferase
MTGLSESRVSSHESRSYGVRAALKQAMRRLREAGVPSHTLAAELLLMYVTGRDRAWLYAHPEEPLAEDAAEKYFELVARRAAGTPTQYLTGRQEFWGLEFEVAPGVLIPRPETEHVVEVALERLGPATRKDDLERRPRGTGLRIADVGTGSGCIAVALAHALPGAQIFATDISEAALELAQRNAARHGVASRIEFAHCNLLDAWESAGAHAGDSETRNSQLETRFSDLEPSCSSVFLRDSGSSPDSRFPAPDSRFHLIVSNPPYVAQHEASALPREVREHEPHAALFGGERGDEIYAPLVQQAERLLRPGGQLVLELGHNSLARVRPLVDNERWTRVTVTNDLAGIPRVLAAEKL